MGMSEAAFNKFEFELVSTAITLSETSLGVKAGGEVIGKPGSCGVEEVRMVVVSMALVDIEGEVTPGSVMWRSSGISLFTEVGGLVEVRSSDLRGGLAAAESRLSEAFSDGGGMLTLSRVAEALVCDAPA